MTIARRSAWAVISAACFAGQAAAVPPPDAPTAWASGPLEVVVALPRAADAAAVAGLVGRTIPYYDEAATKPGEPLGSLAIAGAAAEEGGRILRLATDPHPRPARYVLDLGPIAPGTSVSYGLGGVEAVRTEGDDPAAEPAWTAWLPTADPAGFRELAAASPEHARRLSELGRPGRLRLDSQVDLPAGKVAATVESSAEIEECLLGDGEPEGGVSRSADGRWVAKFTFEDAPGPAYFSLAIRTGPAVPTPTVKLMVSEAGGPPRELEPSRYLLPWASAALGSGRPAPMEIPDLAGGDAARGEAAFFSKEALCSQCHVVKGNGQHVGPDLTTIGRKGAEHLYRSIAVPSEAITPDYVTYTVSLKDGRVAAGVVRAEGPDAIRVVDTEAKSVTLPRAEIDGFRPAATSIMPVGLVPVLGEARIRDIVAYLMATAKD